MRKMKKINTSQKMEHIIPGSYTKSLPCVGSMKSDMKGTISLIEAWTHWATGGGNMKESRSNVRLSRIYHMDSVCGRSIDVASAYSKTAILGCERAWRSLPWLYNRFIQYYYVGNASVRTVCHLCRIRQREFEGLHYLAIASLHEKLNELKVAS